MPTITFICDVKGWAFDIASRNLAQYLPYKCSVAYYKQEIPKADCYVLHHVGFARKYSELRPRIIKLSGFRALDDVNGALPDAEGLVATNAALAAKYDAKLIPNGLDLEVFKPGRVCNTSNILGFVGNADTPYRYWYKGYPYAVLAAQELGMQFEQARYDYTEMPAFYNRIKCLVHPSLGEGCSNAIMEALACDTPVITTQTGFHGDACKRGEATFVTRDVDEIVRAVGVVTAAPRRAFAEKHHDIRNVATLWREVIEEALIR